MSESKILKTKIVTTIGMSVEIDGDWVKTGHEVHSECTGYPSEDMYSTVARRQLADAIRGCSEQIDLIAAKVGAKK